MVTRVLGYPGTQIPVSASSAAAQTLKGEQIVYGNPGTRVPVSSGTRVPGSGSASTAPHPVGYPVPNFEAGVQLYRIPGINISTTRRKGSAGYGY